MPNAVACAGCAAGLAVPAGAAGKVLRCPRCGTLNPIAAEPEPPRVRAERARERDRDGWDDEPRPRRRRRGSAGVPGWAWAVAGSVVAVGVAVVLGLALARRGPDPAPAVPQVENPPPDPVQIAAQGMAPETWVARTHDSGVSWEFPTTGETGPLNSTVRVADQKPLSFSVTVKDVSPTGRPDREPVAELRKAAPGGSSRYGQVESVRTIDGRPAAVVRSPNYTTLAVAEPGRTWEFQVFLPQRDEGGARVRRFFDSVRFTRPPPPDPTTPSAGGTPAADGGEVVPPGWDRVAVPRTTLTVLMPKGSPSGPWTRRGFEGSLPVARGLLTPAGEEIDVTACYVEPKAVGPAVADPFGGVRDQKAVTAAGRPAQLSHREFGGTHMVHLRVGMGEPKFLMVVVTGPNLSLDAPVVKRVVESVSETLPARLGPEAADVAEPPVWVRRFLPGGTFSVEVPGAVAPGNEAAVALGPGVAGGLKTRLPLPGRKEMHFAVTGLGIGGPNQFNPAKLIEMEADALRGNPKGPQLVRRVTVDGRPGFVAARADAKGGLGVVRMRVQDAVMGYTLVVTGPGFTPDTPEVKRFIDSARFDLRPPAGPPAPPPPAAGPAAPPAAPPAPSPGAGSRP